MDLAYLCFCSWYESFLIYIASSKLETIENDDYDYLENVCLRRIKVREDTVCI